MSDFFFYLFAFLTVACAALVVLNKSAVNAALFLLLSLVGMAGLFVQLDAGLLAFVLLLVYAGAVVALFLFIIMLLNTEGSTQPFKKMTVAASLLGALLLGLGIYTMSTRVMLTSSAPTAPTFTLKHYAEQLFTVYLLPVQVVGFLLLVAMLGVIVLSKKFETPEGTK